MPLYGIGVPSGALMPYAGSTAPTGYLLCDGSAISRTTYASLFTAIGTSFGAGDGSTTFNLPDTRNVFLRGANASTRTISTISYPAVTLGATATDKVQGHIHALDSHVMLGQISTSSLNSGIGGGGAYPNVGTVNDTSGATQGTKSATTMNSDGTNGTPRTGTETAPVNLGVNYIIKT